MTFRFHQARRRATVAGLVGALLVVVFGLVLAVPAVALVALVYYSHRLAGDETVVDPSLAFVIIVNSLVVLLVQGVVFLEGLGRGV